MSHYQGSIDWMKVKAAGISFAFLKATEGTTFVDDRYAENLQGAKQAGLIVGAYHFFRASTEAVAQAEADFFIEVVGRSGGFRQVDLPPVIDAEVSENTPAAVRAWVDRVKEKTGKTSILYTYPSFIDDYLGSSLSDLPLWLASYSRNQPANRGGWDRWVFLQYSESGTVPGISGPVDLDEYSGSVDELMASLQPSYLLTADDANKVIAFFVSRISGHGCA